ncbi:MAG: hypothetical protein JW774_09785 [Candidatus Aureabacteria bacterium]|nr:hypothetical protein [Candidatus Auribacterota bacterium]
MIPFTNTFIDIVGYCNAHCPYCNTSNNKMNKDSILTPKIFNAILDTLFQNNLIDHKSILHLYNWGEPFLHPQLHDIIHVLNQFDCKYAVSTNGSIIPKIDKSFVKNLVSLSFSMPGFSQKSYDRIHALPFEKIRQNIIQIAQKIRRINYHNPVSILYHIYQFNLDEMKSTEEFALKHGIQFKPYFAILNNWHDLNAYVHGNLSYDTLMKVSEDLFSFDIRQKIKNNPPGYHCPQSQYLVLDEQGNVFPCCQVPKSKEFTCGNLMTDSIDSILENRSNHPACKDCLASGLAYYLNTSLTTPIFYNKNKINLFSFNNFHHVKNFLKRMSFLIHGKQI